MKTGTIYTVEQQYTVHSKNPETGEPMGLEGWNLFDLMLTRDTDTDRFRFVNITSGTIHKQSFSTKLEAIEWLNNVNKWRIRLEKTPC